MQVFGKFGRVNLDMFHNSAHRFVLQRLLNAIQGTCGIFATLETQYFDAHSALRKQLKNVLLQYRWIKMRCDGHSGKLVHPIRRLRGHRSIPTYASCVEHIHIPRGSRRRQYPAVSVAEPSSRVPVLLRAMIGNKGCAACHMLAMRAELRNPHRKWYEVRARVVGQDRVLNRSRAFEAEAACRAHKHNDPNLAGGGVECIPKRFAAFA